MLVVLNRLRCFQDNGPETLPKTYGILVNRLLCDSELGGMREQGTGHRAAFVPAVRRDNSYEPYAKV